MSTKKLLFQNDNPAIISDLLHHFYIIEGDPVTSYGALIPDLEEKGISVAGNSDIYLGDHQSMNIEEARLLKDFFAMRSFSNAKRIAIIKAQTVTREAQNALLKLTEETVSGSHIFFLVPHTGLLIATLLSRAEIISKKVDASTKEGEDFVRKDIGERMVYVQKIITKKDKEAAVVLVDSIIAYLREENKIKGREEVYKVRSYLEDTSSSIKLLLEHLSLILPTYV